MDKLLKFCCGCIISLALAVGGIVSIMAATGDIYRVTSERVNLRTGPSNEADVRTVIEAGDEVIELRREGSWLGVRVLETGDEGWIYEGLVERVARSLIVEEEVTVPVEELPENFESLINSINDYVGYDLVDQVEQLEDNILRIIPTREWLLYTSREAHLMATVAFYQMWKGHHDDRAVSVIMVDHRNEPYITIDDEEPGPVLSVREPHQE